LIICDLICDLPITGAYTCSYELRLRHVRWRKTLSVTLTFDLLTSIMKIFIYQNTRRH